MKRALMALAWPVVAAVVRVLGIIVLYREAKIAAKARERAWRERS